MSDGNSQSDGCPTGLSAPTVSSPVGGPFESNTHVMPEGGQFSASDPFTLMSGTLTSTEGSVPAYHHNLNAISVVEPTQDYAGLRDAGAQ